MFYVPLSASFEYVCYESIRPLEIILILQSGDRFQTSESDVYRRQIMTSEVDPRAVRVSFICDIVNAHIYQVVKPPDLIHIYPVNRKRLLNVGSMLVQRRRQWTSIIPTCQFESDDATPLVLTERGQTLDVTIWRQWILRLNVSTLKK